MANNSNRFKLVLSIIAVAGTVLVALIEFQPWKNSVLTKSPVYNVFSGMVIDSASNAIYHAEISIAGRNEHYYTEQNGNFRILIKDEIPFIRIFVRKTGFTSYDKTFNLPDTGVVLIMTK